MTKSKLPTTIGLCFKRRPFVNLIRLINRIEPGSGALFRQNYKKNRTFDSTFRYLEYPDRRPSSMLNAAFIWDGTPEGHDFWKNIRYKLLKEEQ